MNVSTSYRPLSSKASLKVFTIFGSSSIIKTLFFDSVGDGDVPNDDNLYQVAYTGGALKGYMVNHTYFSHFLDKLMLMYHYRDNTILGSYVGVKIYRRGFPKVAILFTFSLLSYLLNVDRD
jgi:hypothetical protein